MHPSSPALVPVPSGSFAIALQPTAMGPVDSLLYLSLIIPTFNEAQNIEQAIASVCQVLDGDLLGNYEVIVVDDNSPDKTWKLAQEMTARYPQVRVMRRQQERGLSTAAIRGWQVARGQILGIMDGDLQHPPAILQALLSALGKGADLAIASRHVAGGGVSRWSFLRRLLSRGAQLLGLLLLPGVAGQVSDPMSGYFLVRRSAIANCPLHPVGYKILLEVLGRGKIRQITEVGYVFQERQEGESKVTWRQYLDYLRHLWRLRQRPNRLKSRWRSFPLSRFLRFGLVGASGVFVDMAILYLLSDPTTLGWGLTRSKAIAAELAILNNFCWNDRWTFGDIARNQQGWPQRVKRLLKFNLICLAGLGLNVLLLNFLFNVLGIDRYLANLIAIAAVTFWNFWLNLKMSWRVTEAE